MQVRVWDVAFCPFNFSYAQNNLIAFLLYVIMSGLDIFLIIVVLIILIILLSGLHILKEWERGAVFTLGRFSMLKGPGVIYVWPIISKVNPIISSLQRILL